MSDFKNCHKIYEGFLYFPLNEAKDGSAYGDFMQGAFLNPLRVC